MKERASGMVAVEDVLHGVVQDPDKVVSIILSFCKGASVTSAESSIDTVSRQGTSQTRNDIIDSPVSEPS